jgi:hypothetical protein
MVLLVQASLPTRRSPYHEGLGKDFRYASKSVFATILAMNVNPWHRPLRQSRPEDLTTAPRGRRGGRGDRTVRWTTTWIVSLIERIVEAHSSAYTAEGTDRTLDAFK